MNTFLRRTWAEIDLDAVKHNYNQIRKSVNPSTKIMCVVKADAYGHGATFLAKEYESLGADWFAVSNIDEAMQLRGCAITKPILILGYTPVCMAGVLAENNISQAILSEKYAIELSNYARKCGVSVNAHIKIDTGMSRIGLMCQDISRDYSVIDSAKRICEIDNINVQGIFTHFAVSDDGEEGRKNTIYQYNNFMFVVNSLRDMGYKLPLCHCGNSGAIIDYKDMNLDMVRAGIILYGLSPSKKLEGKLDLKPVMQLKSVVSQLKDIEDGTTVSYGKTFTAKGKRKIATVPIGYADGYSRGFSNKAKMIINGKRVPVIGRVCMDQLMLDVTDVEDVREGSVVTVFGTDNSTEVSVNELAGIINTINYELICLVGKRVTRVYMKDGNQVGQFNYIQIIDYNNKR